jgi:hypothetical protein
METYKAIYDRDSREAEFLAGLQGVELKEQQDEGEKSFRERLREYAAQNTEVKDRPKEEEKYKNMNVGYKSI